MVTSWSGAATGTVERIMMTVKRKVLLQIPLGHQRVRSVCFVAGAGTSLPRPVGRLIVATTPPTSGATSLASAQSSSRSQLAVHSDFAFEREGSTKILVSGVEGRSAARQNVLVTTDNRKDHRRWSSDCSKMLLLSATETIPLYLHTAQPESATLRPSGFICAAAIAQKRTILIYLLNPPMPSAIRIIIMALRAI